MNNDSLDALEYSLLYDKEYLITKSCRNFGKNHYKNKLKENEMNRNEKTFNVGDKVKGITNLHKTFDDCVIIEVSNENPKQSYKVLMNDGSKQWCFNSTIELVEPQYTFTSKFNIGDKVINKDGELKIINSIAFWKDYIEYYTVDKEYYLENRLELYKEPKIDYKKELMDFIDNQGEIVSMNLTQHCMGGAEAIITIK